MLRWLEVERKQVLAQHKKVSNYSAIVRKSFLPGGERILYRDVHLSGVAVEGILSLGGEMVLKTSAGSPHPGAVRHSDTSQCLSGPQHGRGGSSRCLMLVTTYGFYPEHFSQPCSLGN